MSGKIRMSEASRRAIASQRACGACSHPVRGAPASPSVRLRRFSKRVNFGDVPRLTPLRRREYPPNVGPLTLTLLCMKNFPALCPSCGLAFGVPNLLSGPGADSISLAGNTTNCPQCSARANILDGEYRWERETVDLISGPPVTMQVFRTLKELLSKPIDPEAALSEIEGFPPTWLRHSGDWLRSTDFP